MDRFAIRWPIIWVLLVIIGSATIGYFFGYSVNCRDYVSRSDERLYNAGFSVLRYQDPKNQKYLIKCPAGHWYELDETSGKSMSLDTAQETEKPRVDSVPRR